MDQKHAMLYGEPNSGITQDQRALASSSIGLPTNNGHHGEPPPPSYDFAVSAGAVATTPDHNPTGSWYTNSTFHSSIGPGQNATRSSGIAPAPAPAPTTAIATATAPASGGVVVPPLPPTPNFARNVISTRSFTEPHTPYQISNPNSTTVHVMNQAHIAKLGPHPCTVFCPSCGTSRSTKMAYTPNTRTHFCAVILCLVGWCCCACLVPYCTNSCRTGNHYCTACNTYLGTYNPQDNNIV